jgi:hypothetical protein
MIGICYIAMSHEGTCSSDRHQSSVYVKYSIFSSSIVLCNKFTKTEKKIWRNTKKHVTFMTMRASS